MCSSVAMHKVLEWSKLWLGDRNTYSAAAVSLLANESAKTTNYFYVKSTINSKQALKLKKETLIQIEILKIQLIRASVTLKTFCLPNELKTRLRVIHCLLSPERGPVVTRVWLQIGCHHLHSHTHRAAALQPAGAIALRPPLGTPMCAATALASPWSSPGAQSWHWNKMTCNCLLGKSWMISQGIKQGHFTNSVVSFLLPHFLTWCFWKIYRSYEAVRKTHKGFFDGINQMWLLSVCPEDRQ